MSMSPIPLMIYASEADNRGKRKTGERKQWVSIFRKHFPRSNKKGGKAFSPGLISDGQTRASANVEQVSLLVADIDDGVTLEMLRPSIAQFSWLAYSSFSHDPENGKHKFRLVFFPARPCTPEEWREVWTGLNTLLGGHCDPACKDPARIYYLPCCPAGMLGHAFAINNEGDLIDPDELKRLVPPAGAMVVTNSLAVVPAKLPPPPETPEQVEIVKSMLASISADCGRDDWTRVLWGLAALNWACGQLLGRAWSETSTKFEESDFLRVWSDYDPAHPDSAGFGSLVYIAKQHGWKPPADSHDLTTGAPGDVLAGRIFATQYRDQLLWVSYAGSWLRWDRMRWTWCTCGEEMAAAKLVADKILERASQLFAQDAERNKRRMAFAMGLQNIRQLEAMTQLAKSETDMAIGHMSALDSGDWLLGCRNGVVNLRNGTLLSPDPAMRITRQVAAEYRPAVDCPRWQAFLLSVFEDDTATVEFVQRALGYTLTGTTTEEVLFICYGAGANGKSVFANVLSTIFSDYGQMAPPSLLTVRREGDAGPRNDVARLCGARLVQINELNQGDRLNEQIVKLLAGREMLAARFLNKEFFDFGRPQNHG